MHLSGFGDTMASSELGFDFRVRKSGDVEITHHGRLAATLRGDAAQTFLSDVEAMDDEDEQQQLMARVTGNVKRGNERTASGHPRNRG
jgi:hypothetical protein